MIFSIINTNKKFHMYSNYNEYRSSSPGSPEEASDSSENLSTNGGN